MTNMKPLHVYCCLETRDKNHRILAALPIHRCPLSFSIIIMNGPERNGKTDRHLWKSLMFMSRDLLLHFVEGPRGKGHTVLNSKRLWNSSERYWNGLGNTLAILYFPAPLRSVLQSLVQALEHFPVPTERSGTLFDGNTT